MKVLNIYKEENIYKRYYSFHKDTNLQSETVKTRLKASPNNFRNSS